MEAFGFFFYLKGRKMSTLSTIQDIPAGFLVMILDSDYFKTINFCSVHGIQYLYAYIETIHCFVFFSYHEYHATCRFCSSERVLGFWYKLEDRF